MPRPRSAPISEGDQTATLHGDLHYDNVLAGTREPWLAIDPKAIVGDPCHEAIAPLWNRMSELVGPRGPRTT